jgi:hypothetical protein
MRVQRRAMESIEIPLTRLGTAFLHAFIHFQVKGELTKTSCVVILVVNKSVTINMSIASVVDRELLEGEPRHRASLTG